MIHIRMKAYTPNESSETFDTVMPARGMPRYVTTEGHSGEIELEIIVSEEKDLFVSAKAILDKLAELDFCAVERPWLN